MKDIFEVVGFMSGDSEKIANEEIHEIFKKENKDEGRYDVKEVSVIRRFDGVVFVHRIVENRASRQFFCQMWVISGDKKLTEIISANGDFLYSIWDAGYENKIRIECISAVDCWSRFNATITVLPPAE